MSRLLLIVIITALISAASAVVCTQAETYCGSRLLKVDSSNRKAIEGALTSGRQSIDDAHIKQSIFWCAPSGVPVPGDSGLLFVTYCGPENICQEGGALGGIGDACALSTGGGLSHRRHHHHH
ncbi:hypothetical protein BDP81DRAFT_400191 [Colletotrichum phormii]|uniref:Uncharacterized protein n=1 Tax=Colletotrichum phormii TaxID=359342 RepID=A0AAI9ZF52_9PEZI|nr:uncharacterized protein BDP81DRAFT_400191 [Colletotrichum phormii]KAK1622450.1 hypothetical protein BDP81DRAFT_400191 [Colletotrichum phormii]